MGASSIDTSGGGSGFIDGIIGAVDMASETGIIMMTLFLLRCLS